jgi:hypothetical protein
MNLVPDAPAGLAPYTLWHVPADRRPMTTARSHHWIPLRTLGVACALAVFLLAGCAGSRLTVGESTASYTMKQAEELARTTPVGSTSSVNTNAAVDLRQQTLVDLRRQGAKGSTVADLLTKGFPAETPAVPILAESATVDGRPSILVVEATPGAGGKLTSRRLWVFDTKTGQVTGSASFR